MRAAPRTALFVVAAAVASACSFASPVAPMSAALAVTTPAPAPPPAAVSTAHYLVVFDSTWSASTHPADFPGNAHYSGLIGGTHSAAVKFWDEGLLASDGIRFMAERGAKSPLDATVTDAIAAGHAEFLLSGPSLPISPASASIEFDITERFPLVTLVTMVAPSPDWFVGVSGLPLLASGTWIDELRVDLYPYDAGTDSGVSYASPDQEAVPRAPIAKLVGYPFASNGRVAPLGTFTFTRLR